MNQISFFEYGKKAFVSVANVGNGSDACFSVRKTNSSYVGNCMKVRRSSDNTMLDIGFDGTDLDTVSLLAFVGAGNGFVDTWYDQSGNSRNLVQHTTTKQPKIVNSGSLITSGGRAIIVFDGVDDIMTIPSSASYFINIHYSTGFISAVIGVTNLNSNNFKGILGTCTGASGQRGFYILYDDRSSLSRNESCVLAVQNGTALQRTIVSYTANDVFLTNRSILNISVNNQNSNSLERCSFYANNNSPKLNNLETNSSSNGNSFNDFVIGSETIGGGAGFYDIEYQEIVLFNSDQKSKSVGFKINQNQYFNIF